LAAVNIWLLSLALLFASSANATTLTLSEKELAQVDAGRLIIHAASTKDSYVKEIHAFLRINAPAEKVFALITDYAHLPSFMPHLERTEVLNQDETGAVVNYYLDLPFGVHKQYRLRLDYDKQPNRWRMSWHQWDWQGLDPEHTIADTTGYWDLKVVDAQTTLLHYYTKTDPGHVPFGLGWIVDYLTEKTVVELLENTKAKAEEQ